DLELGLPRAVTLDELRPGQPFEAAANPNLARLTVEAKRNARRHVWSTLSPPGTREGLEPHMFEDVTVIGAGRAGTAIAARLRERGLALRDDAELCLLCVPDRAIADVARSIESGPWVA